jgi:bifunctional non-homologous end joining protein LigD
MSNNKSKGKIKIRNKTLELSNLNKVFFPDEGYTKGDIIEFYKKISKYILPYLKNRPESLLRNPDGIKKNHFIQKDVNNNHPGWIKTKKIYAESADKYVNYLVCNDELTLLYIANLGCIEIHPWFSQINKLDRPNYAVLDLDPEGISFGKVVETALTIKKVLDTAEIKSFCKTSGATGLHIYVPLNAKYKFDESKKFALTVAKIVNNLIPDITSLERKPSKRKKKVYIDCYQNSIGQTLAAPYSLRPRPGATVSTPLKWSEVNSNLDPKNYTIKNIFRRLGHVGDLFEDMLGKGINIEKCIKKLEKKYGSKLKQDD